MIRADRIAISVCLAVLMTVVIAGCAATRSVDVAALEDSPADFVLSVTVLSPPSVEMRPLSLRNARYILEPDGALRAALGPGVTPSVYPPRARQLPPHEVERTWRLVRDSGLLDEPSPYAISSLDGQLGSPTRVIAVVQIVGGETRRFRRVPLEDTHPTARGTRLVIERLARLAGIAE